MRKNLNTNKGTKKHVKGYERVLCEKQKENGIHAVHSVIQLRLSH